MTGKSRLARPVLPGNCRCLVVNGSLHPVAAAQVNHARNSGLFGGDDSWVLFEYCGEETGVDRARAVGDAVQQVLKRHAFDAIIVFGGDTAYGIHEALGSDDFDSCGEVMPGVPMSRSNGMYWITKAGGFGQEDLLERLNNHNE
jgi:D-threonate/D-erythronate kinase